MQAREFAFRILCSPTIEEKFAKLNGGDRPSCDIAFSERESPFLTYPARELRIVPVEARRAKLKSGQLTGLDLGSDRDRAHLLHSFANHELLATELFSWAILRFSMAKDFEQGLVRIILDEQRHFRLYEERIRELGFEFGDFPINNFMWRTITRCKTLEQFTAAMSLSFEQANLDFAAFYAEAFARAGDFKTEAVLKTVLADEIQHVKHGLHWFEHQRPAESSLIDFHKKSLVFPLTLARAQGSRFQVEARVKAGFGDDYISELQTFSASKGRPPRLFYFNPDSERENIYETPRYSSSANTELLRADLSSLMMFLAAKEDVVVVSKRPKSDFLRGLAVRGYEPCGFFESKDFKKDRLKFRSSYHHLGNLEPWGWSPVTHSLMSPLRDLLTRKDAGSTSYSCEVHRLGKKFAHELRQIYPWPLDSLSRQVEIVKDAQALSDKLEKMLDSSGHASTWVAKAPLGNSGHSQVKFSREKPLTIPVHSWMTKTILQQGAVILEPWVDKVLDLSVVGAVGEDGVKIWGMTRFITDEHGRYHGTHFGHPYYGISRDLVRAFHQPLNDGSGHSDFTERLLESANWVGLRLSERGYQGPFGVDSFVYHSDSSVTELKTELRSIVEVNTRWTMGHIAHNLQKQYRGRPGSKAGALWCHLLRSGLEKKGFSTFLEFHNAMQEKYGDLYFATNDPQAAQICLTFVAPTFST